MSTTSSSAKGLIGIVLTRMVVPLWVLVGAVIKLLEHTPKLLPKNIWTNAAEVGIDLHVLLAVLIALELFAVAVMFFLRPFARAMAIFMLVSFCLILIGEIAVGNTSCGCLGAHSPSPWVMLGIDGALLVGVILFKPVYAVGRAMAMNVKLAAVAWTVAGVVLSGVMILPHAKAGTGGGEEVVQNGGSSNDGQGNGTNVVTPPVRAKGPGKSPDKGAIVPKTHNWVGQRWEDIPFAEYMKAWPDKLNEGAQYLIFYSRSCDHCQLLLEEYFYDQVGAEVMLIAVPESKSGFDTAGELDMLYCKDCFTESEMPVGTEWMLTPPLVVALEDGVVKCAVEGEDAESPQCLIWH